MARDSQVKVVLRAEDKTGPAFNSATRQTTGFRSSLNGLIGTLGTAGLVGGLTAVIKSTADFESQLANVSTLISGDSANAISGLRRGINELVQEIPKSADELGASAYQIVSAGITDTSEALKVLKASSRLAVAGLGTTEEATDLLTSAINAFNLEAGKAEDVADILFKAVKNGKTTVTELAQGFGQIAPLANATKVSFEELTAITSAVTTSGQSASVVYTQLRAVISNLLKPTAEMQDAFSSLGITNIEAKIQSDGLLGTIRELSQAMESNGINASKAFSSVEALNVVMAINGELGNEAIRVYEEMTNGQNALDEAVQKQTQTFNSQVILLKNEFMVLFRELAIQLMPMMIKAVEILRGAMDELTFQWERWTGFLSNHIDTIDAVIEKMKELLELIKNVIANLNVLPGLKVGSVVGKIKDIGAKILGFDNGGVVPGRTGEAKLVMAHAGETILPTHKSNGAGTGINVVINNPTLLDSSMVSRLSDLIGSELRRQLRV